MQQDPTPQHSHKQAIFWAILSTGLSSLAIIIQADLARLCSPYQLIFLSSALASIALACLIPFFKQQITLAKIKANWVPLVMILILRCLCGGVTFWYALAKSIGIKAVFFTKAEPYFILFWQWLIDRKTISRQHFALLALHLIGAAMLSLGGLGRVAGEEQWGDLLLLLAVFVLALSYRFARQTVSELGAIGATLLPQLMTAILVGACFLLTQRVEALTSCATNILPQLIIVTVMWNILGLLCWFLALRVLEPWIVSALRGLGPLIAAPIAWFFWGQNLTVIQILGAAIVLLTSFRISTERTS